MTSSGDYVILFSLSGNLGEMMGRKGRGFLKKVRWLIWGMGSFPCLAQTKESGVPPPIQIAFSEDPSSLDPAHASDAWSQFWIGHLMEGLITRNSQGELVPAGAHQIVPNSSGTKVLFRLRPEALWDDGEKVTAISYVNAFRRLVDPQVGSPNSFLVELIKLKNATLVKEGKLPPDSLGVKALSDSELELELESPIPYLHSILSLPAFVPVRLEELQKKDKAFGPEGFKVNGAFKLNPGGWKRSVSLKLDKNQKYHLQDRVKIGGVHASIVTSDKMSQYHLFLSKQLDYYTITKSIFKALQNQTSKMHCRPNGNVRYMALNQRKDRFFSDVERRKQLAMGFPTGEFVQKITGLPGDKVAQGLVPGVIQLPKPLNKSYRTLFPMEPFPAKPLLQSNPSDLTKDKSSTVTLEMITGASEMAIEAGEYVIQAIEKKLGWKVRLTSLPLKTFYARAKEGNFDLYIDTWVPDFEDPLTYLEIFKSGSPNNKGQFSHSAYDLLLDQSFGVSEVEKRSELLYKAEKILVQEMVGVLPLVHNSSCSLIRPELKGVQFPPTGVSPDFRFSHWNH